ncbi:hypothetical protein diail_11660 [Diaporthe ilicicola]|nr:hypothetical protein diail_11660 [Diaporthe ilicicola]
MELCKQSMTSVDHIMEDVQQSRALPEVHTSPVSIEELKEIMIGNGWCYHQVEYLTQIYELPVLCRLAQLDRKAQRPEDHSSCLKEKNCIAYNSPRTETYQTQHAANCLGGNCSMIKVPYKDLVRIIQSGGVPLISIHEHPDTGLTLSVHRREFRGDYATISHVWADGLGNPRENALPRCQIKLLHSLMDYKTDVKWSDNWIKRADHMIFGGRGLRMLWIDTLCIPANDASLRLQCIDAMASIYAGSSRVFVLDKEIMAIPVDADVNKMQILEQVICSVWMCRSWTLQEAILPEECVFVLDGGIFKPLPVRYNYGTGDAADAIRRAVFDDFLKVRDRALTSIESFVSTWNNLAGRSTTQIVDLYVVLASCLGFKLRQFQKFDSLEEKMQRIIFSFQELPFSLFFNAGPRLRSASNHYNRWVPTQVSRHLLTAGSSTFVLPGPNVSQYSDQGMRLELRLGSDLSIYVVDEVISMPSAYNIQTSDGHYMIQPVLDPADTFETTAYCATCLVIANSSLGASSTRSGACFYMFGSQASDYLHHEQSVIEMAYFCPVLFKVLNKQSHQDDDDDRPTFAAHAIACTRKFGVRFGTNSFQFLISPGGHPLSSLLNMFCHVADPLPGFKPLKRQNQGKQFSGFGWNTTLIIIFLTNLHGWAVLVVLIFWGVATEDEEHPDTTKHRILLNRRWIGMSVLFTTPFGVSILSLPWAIAVFIAVRVRDYTVLYRSYDDESVVDKSARLLAVVGKTTYEGLCGVYHLSLVAFGLIKLDKGVPTESLEI